MDSNDSKNKYTRADMEKEYNDFLARMEDMDQRVEKMRLVNEDAVVMQRIDYKSINTSLFVDPAHIKDRVRESWIGRVIAVSPFDSGDDVKETKKKALKRGDIISFNPDFAYSLNVPGFYEIWTLAVQNILVVDDGLDYLKMYKESLEKRVELFEAREKAEKELREERANLLKEKDEAKRVLDEIKIGRH